MKRFWSTTKIVSSGDEYTIQLDARPLKLTAGPPLAVPFLPLAEAIEAEWQSVNLSFTADDLPLTQLTTTAQERIRLIRPETVKQLVAYGVNDLLCYRSEHDPELAAREREVWQPWIEWANQRYCVHLKTTSGIIPVHQPAECAKIFSLHLNAMTEYQLAGMGVMVGALGSLILSFAVEAGVLQSVDACDCANLSEIWQESRWGADDEAIARRKMIHEDVALGARFINLCRG
jgi:chaperone required for assembly of F1-ATPase